MRKRLLSFVLAVLMIATLLPVTALAYTTYYINGVAVRCDDFDSSPNECWTYANNIYNKIWGQQFNSLFDDSANSLRNLSDSELTLTAEHLKNYVSNAALGSALRICSSEYLHGGDGWGHSQIIVQKDSNGFTVLQGGLSASPYRNERYYTWSEYLNSWNYAYIKYIKWPGAPAYGGGTVTPDPGLSVKETITCKRTIKLPARVVNLYSNPTDTTRLTYFDYGPTVYSSRYAVMSDGSIMYEVGATNHQGQDIKVWLKYESDMTVTKQHTYGSTKYESAHPHRGYKTCQCGDKFYTGETTARSDCSECNANVKYAVDGGYITFDRKTGTITDCDSMVTKANIPQKIEGVAVKSIGANAFNNQQHLESVTIPDGVTSIGERAFCSSGVLTSVKIPDSVTSIGAYAFDTCSSLTNVTIPNGVTSIEEHTFDSCISLTSVTIPDSVTSIGEGAFYDCSSLTSVTIPDSVTSIGDYAFYGCKSLTSVAIPDSVTCIGNCAFWKCSSLASVTIPDSVTSIGEQAFQGCESLTSVTIPDSVTSISSYTFASCTSLTSVTIPNSVTSIGEFAFRCCKSLTSVAIPNSVTSIGERAFSECTSLTSVTIPDSVTSIGVGAFASCTSLTGIWVAEGNSHYSSDASGVLFSKDKTTLVQCPGTLAACMIPDSVTSIVGYAFAGCTSLTNVTIPDSVTSIGSHAFSYCKSLTSVTIPDSVTSIGGSAFGNCTSLTSVTIPDSVTSIGDWAFSHCTSLTSVTIPDSVTSINWYAFYNCKSLTDVYYAGSEAQWKAISISSTGNDDLLNANIHYNYVSHTHSYKDVVTAPTCTEKGYTTHTCACGDSYVDAYVDALGHNWNNGKVTKEPTETEDGVKTYTCTRCGEIKTEAIPKLTHEHNYKDVVTAPTCTDKGYTMHTCACGDSYVDSYVLPLGHDWGSGKVTKEPTATENGIKTYICARCGETKTEVIPALSHEHSYKAVVTAPTCTEKGYTTHTCACGDSYVDTYVDALGHAWDGGTVTKQPTATETGVRTYTCTRCSATKTETIPATGSVDVTQMFTDVTKNWAYPGIQYCVTHGIMGGMGDGTFAPTGTTTRAQIVQILYNLEGTPAVSGTTPFTDLTANWYKPAILWAYQNNVVAGTSPTTFAPDQPVTREQIAVILTQYMFHVLKMERTWTPADLSTFPDGANVSSWAKEAMQDAVALGLINGTKAPDGVVYLDPQGSAARQQVATILMNFCQNVKK